ncbi:hypothetical protein [Prosthecobacter dejongeii]|uniref:PEP-CTERM protein-sorting domain-containing protein n=1 Tax=Prosthecobacter dejongeii TaxID=48465 RepID=A0A7W8DRR4_9BACT|nr:hypothetical protein [Prosthecobacter dejongeii]MBB5039575.1 hypothetical protein [Prosthecobacter dejongeii]
MKYIVLFFSLLFASALPLSAQSIFNGVDYDGYIGVYDINDQHYWWLCVEPESTPAAGAGTGFIADAVSILNGWDQQNTERRDDYIADSAAQAALAKQVAVIEYVLDTYLPISTLTTPGALLQGSENAAYYGNNEAFYNSMNVVQHFLVETYGKTTKVDFTDMTGYGDRWELDLSAAGMARSDLYQSILTDVAAKDGTNFFDTYTAVNGYYIANTLYSLNNTDPLASDYNWQDVLIIVAPVPEPSGALLIACCGFAVLFRRWRKLA